MSIIVVLFNLKADVSADDYEAWALGTDLPTVNQLPSVKQFSVLRGTGLLGSDAPSPFNYIELIEVHDLEQLGTDVASEKMQAIAAEFQAFADNPQFIVTQSISASE